MKIKSYIFLIVTLLSTWAAQAQRISKFQNLASYDDQPFHFGFLLGLNSSSFNLKYSSSLASFDSIKTVNPRNSFGFDIAIITNVRMGKHFDLRFTIPHLSFMERELIYNEGSTVKGMNAEVLKQIESIFVNFPMEIKFKSNRVNNYRWYVFGGASYSIDMASRKKDTKKEDQDPIKLDKNEYGYYYGIGLDYYLTFTKLSPFIKVYNGLNSTLIKDGRQMTTGISSLTSHIIYFGITFE